MHSSPRCSKPRHSGCREEQAGQAEAKACSGGRERRLPLERIEFFSSVGHSFEAEAVKEIERSAGPFVLLVLVVSPEYELRDRVRVEHAVCSHVPSLIAEAV